MDVTNEDPAVDRNRRVIQRYYDRTESRLGYQYLLRGGKHYGWYEAGQSMWRFEPAMRRMEDQLGERLHLPADSSVLDAGCGTGVVARAMATRFGLRVTGIDILDWNIEQANAKRADAGLTERTSFLWGDYHNLDFPSGTFDGAYTMETLVHSAAPRIALKEFARVLAPGGILVLFEYSHRGRESMSSDAWRSLEQVCKLAAMPAWLEFRDGVLDSMLDDVGFVDVATDDVTEHMLPMLHAFSILGRFPYAVARRLDSVEKAVNAMSGVEMYRFQEAWRYNITVARKPTA